MDLLNFKLPEEHLSFKAGMCSAGDLAELFRDLRNLDTLTRYEIYTALHREYWATDAGYLFLPELIKILDTPHDLIDLEVVYYTGSIQLSALEGDKLTKHLLLPHISEHKLKRTLSFLETGIQFCDMILYRSMVTDLSESLKTHL